MIETLASTVTFLPYAQRDRTRRKEVSFIGNRVTESALP